MVQYKVESVDETLNFAGECGGNGYKGFTAYLSGNVMFVNESLCAEVCGYHVILLWH